MTEKNKEDKEEIASFELKSQIMNLLFDFTAKYVPLGENCLCSSIGNIMVNVLAACLSEVQYQFEGYPAFTSKQIDHICYQIGEWYLMMKPLLEGQHNLGHMKEKLKLMICGE